MILSFIVIASPIAWMVWYTMNGKFVELTKQQMMEFIFAWCMTVGYFLCIVTLIIAIKIGKMDVSWNAIWYISVFKALGYKSIKLDDVQKYYGNLVVIKIVLDELQTDIGIIVLSYILETDTTEEA